MLTPKKLLTKTSESECANHVNKEYCSTNAMLNNIKQYIIKIDDNISPIDVINIAKKKLNCDSESCVLTHSDTKKYIPQPILDYELNTRFKAIGPRNTTELLNNINIDETMLIWAREYKQFYPCPFAMIDFDTNGNKFGYINLSNLINGKEQYIDPIYGIIHGPFTTFGCVLNTDVYTGKGKHWICVFADMRYNNWTIEFFNSSGNRPCYSLMAWMEKQRKYLLSYNKNTSTVVATNITHQTDNHSCGSYALYYIRSRLDNIPYEYFANNRIMDKDAVEFRKHLFRYH